ncbi:gp53-like domain-containing protein [Pseudomonas extremaustralis]
MDYPISVPSVGLVGGKFVDEDPVQGTPGSLIPSVWGNSVTDELLAVISAAGLVAAEADLTQLLQAIRRIAQVGAGGSGVDTGVANAYAVAYAPAVQSRADMLVLRFKVKTTNTGPSTFSPNGLAAKSIVGRSQASLQGGEIVADGICTVVWSTTLDKWVLISCTGGGAEASQLDAETGTDNKKWMSPLRVFQAIAKVVVQATETAFGWAKVATQVQTNAGTDDATIVTPKKLRFGFAISLTPNGYIAFPTWLGGLVIQWGSVAVPASGTSLVTFPLAFPNETLALFASLGFNSYTASSTPFVGIQAWTAKVSASIQNGYSSSASLVYWLALGR